MLRHVLLTSLIATLASCAAPIKEQKNAYSYVGRVVEKGEEVVVEPLDRATNSPALAMREEMVRGPLGPVFKLLPTTKSVNYQHYRVALDQGESVTLRSFDKTIDLNDCVRVWIAGPGISPVYLYAPDQAQVERATECKVK